MLGTERSALNSAFREQLEMELLMHVQGGNVGETGILPPKTALAVLSQGENKTSFSYVTSVF